jgi:subtilase family serine protease
MGPAPIKQAVPLYATVPAAATLPSTLQALYGSASFGGVQGDGSGQTIAIVDAFDAPTIEADLIAFDAHFSLPDPPSFQKLNQHGGLVPPQPAPQSAYGSWAIESSLDVEWAHVMAPKADLLLVEADDASGNSSLTAMNLGQAIYTASHYPGVSVVSMSFGVVSGSPGVDDALFSVPGVVFVGASGDNTTPPFYPAYSSNVVSVGGTSFQSGPQHESGWALAGLGQNAQEAQPWWQHALLHEPSRLVPDVSALADPATGVPVYDSYDLQYTSAVHGDEMPGPWLWVGGTSLACPLWAGELAVADQLRGSPYDSASVLPALYALPAADYHQVYDEFSGPNRFGFSDLNTGIGLGSPSAALVEDLALYSPSEATGTVVALSLAVASNPIYSGEGLSAAITTQQGKLAPSSGVAFYDGNTLLDTVIPVRGQSNTVQSLSSGLHLITAVSGGVVSDPTAVVLGSITITDPATLPDGVNLEIS